MGFPKGITKATSTGATVVITSANGPTTNFEVTSGLDAINQLTGDVTAGPGVGSQAATLVGTAAVNTVVGALASVTAKMATATYDAAGLATQVLCTTSTQTMSNKRNTKRVYAYSGPGATPTIDTDTYDVVNMTALATAITSMTTNLSGTPNSFDSLILGFTDNGTARAITWGTSFEASTVALPTTTVISTLLLVGFLWNPTTSKWRCVASA